MPILTPADALRVRLSLTGMGGMGAPGAPYGFPQRAAPFQPQAPQIMSARDQEGEKWDKRIDDATKGWTRDVEKRERYVRLYREGHFPQTEDGEKQGANVNLCYAFVQLVTALLGANLPIPEIDPRRGDGDKDLAEAIEGWLKYSLAETETDEVNRCVIFGAILQGIGWSHELYDPDLGMDIAEPLTALEVYVDPLAKYSLRQARFIIRQVTQTIEEARRFFNTNDLEPNHMLSEELEGSIARDRAQMNQNESADKQLYRFHEIWCKEGDERKLYYRDRKESRWLGQDRQWPFRLDGNDWPFSPLIFNTDYRAIDGFSDQEVVEDLQREVNELAEFDRRHTRKGAACKIAYDKDRIDDTVADKLMSESDYELIGVEGQGKPLNQAVQVLDLLAMQNTDNVKAIYERAKQLHDEVLGLDELLRAADTRKMTATEAKVREDMGRLRSALKVGAIDRWQNRTIRHRVQIARQLVDPQLVAKAVGPDEAMAFALRAGDAEDLVREFSIGVKAGSTGERYRQERELEAERNLQLLMQANQYHLNIGGAPRYDIDLAIKELQEARLVRNPEKYILPPPPPPPAAGPMVPGLGGDVPMEGPPAPAGPPGPPM